MNEIMIIIYLIGCLAVGCGIGQFLWVLSKRDK